MTRPLGAYVTESQFAETVIQLAHYRGWRVVHFRPARTEKGWRTAMVGDRGFPDLVLARRGVVLHVELKRQDGRMGLGQPEWATAIGDSYRLWRPSDMEEIKTTLQ